MIIRLVAPLVLILLLLSSNAVAQSEKERDCRSVFEEIQQGIASGNVGQFSQRFASQVQVNLKGEESGYYSSNHAYFILEKYLKARKVISFEFTSVSDTEATPYATGNAVFRNRGTREIVQVYVSLMQSADRWVIAEINIY